MRLPQYRLGSLVLLVALVASVLGLGRAMSRWEHHPTRAADEILGPIFVARAEARNYRPADFGGVVAVVIIAASAFATRRAWRASTAGRA